MRKEWFFDSFCGAQLALYAEDGKLQEARFELCDAEELTGNIYKGKVANIVPGMQAAFVSCGLERNCYLPLDERAERLATYDGAGGVHDPLVLREGDEVLVQIVKPARGNKGAKVTCDLSFVGKNLIYLPGTEFYGISRKITDPETRAALLVEAERLCGKGEGLIFRTAAATADKRHLKIEAEYLKRMWRSVRRAAESAAVGEAVYREYGLPFKVLRDSLGGGVTHIYVGDPALYEKVVSLARMRPDLGERKVELYTGKTSMLRAFSLADQVAAMAARTVPLENGGYLVIDPTEAMTVIDVNTGRFVGEHDLESTVFQTNLLAAREIARQVRLRNVGGLVAVDFIDMAEETHRTAVNAALEEALSLDRAKSRVLPMGDMCVTLFTRKRTSADAASFFLKPCPHCTRQGYVLSDRYLAMRLRGDIIDRFADGYRAVRVELDGALMKSILSAHMFAGELRGAWRGKRVYLIPHDGWNERFTVTGDNAPVLTLPDNAQILY